MKKNLVLSLMAVFTLILATCGPSATPGSPTTVGSAATPAPVEPTAAPYELSVKVTNQDGDPITWATGIFQDLRNEVPMTTDSTGQMVWDNLSNSSGPLKVSAQGYIPTQQSLSLEPGSNTLSIVLEKDPNQLDPGKVCLPDQKILYVEDFEDGLAQDLDGLARTLKLS